MTEIHGRAFAISLALVMTAAPQVAAQLNMNDVLQPCCVVESQDAAGTSLLLKNSASGALLRATTPSTSYRVGQAVDMNSAATVMAITPFPAEYAKEGAINSNSAWKMRTRISVSKEGVIDGQTRITSSSLAGFTGGVEVFLVDRGYNTLHQTSLRTYGVTGTGSGGASDRTENWSETASVPAINRVRAVVIHHSYEPTVRLAAGLGWIRDNSQGVFRVLNCTILNDGGKTAAGGRRPASGAQPSALAIQCSE